jgi:ADP-ribosyl-[dinitrogen reductase] hydrolase
MAGTKEQYEATLVGTAIGDTLGMPVEGWSREQIARYIGRVTGPIEPMLVFEGKQLKIVNSRGKPINFSRDMHKGEYTDDTILTLAIAESLGEKKGIDLQDIAQKQLSAYTALLKPNGKAKGGFGGTTVKGLKRFQAGVSPYESGIIGSPGNAPAMKMSPLGLYMDAAWKYTEGLYAAENIGRITHLDPRSVASGVVQAHATFALLQGIRRKEFLGSLVYICTEYEKPVTKEFTAPEKGSLLLRLQWIRQNMDASLETAYRHLGNSGIVLESYPFALFAFQKYWDYPKKGLLEAINYGGDCDTTGAIFGALSGARHGMWFPKEWLAEAKGLDRLVVAADRIYAIGRR